MAYNSDICVIYSCLQPNDTIIVFNSYDFRWYHDTLTLA